MQDIYWQCSEDQHLWGQGEGSSTGQSENLNSHRKALELGWDLEMSPCKARRTRPLYWHWLIIERRLPLRIKSDFGWGNSWVKSKPAEGFSWMLSATNTFNSCGNKIFSPRWDGNEVWAAHPQELPQYTVNQYFLKFNMYINHLGDLDKMQILI